MGLVGDASIILPGLGASVKVRCFQDRLSIDSRREIWLDPCPFSHFPLKRPGMSSDTENFLGSNPLGAPYGQPIPWRRRNGDFVIDRRAKGFAQV